MILFHIHKNIIKKMQRNCKKKLLKDIKIFVKKKTRKSSNTVMNVTKISQKRKNKTLLSIGKKYKKHLF